LIIGLAPLGSSAYFFMAACVAFAVNLTARQKETFDARPSIVLDPCVAVVPLLATATWAVVTLRSIPVSVRLVLLAAFLSAFACAAAAFTDALHGAPWWLLALAPLVPLTVLVFPSGILMMEAAYMLTAGATAASILLVWLFAATARLVFGFAAQQLAPALSSAIGSAREEFSDGLHEQILNRLSVIGALLHGGSVDDAWLEIDQLSDELRYIRATEATGAPGRVPELLDVLHRRYQRVLTVEVDALPAALAIPLSVPSARQFARIVDELFANAAKHAATSVGVKPVLSVTATRKGRHSTFVIADDGPGLRQTSDGTLRHLISQANRTPGWRLDILPSDAGAKFALTVRAEERE
jgi:signal transduction histidine kinase